MKVLVLSNLFPPHYVGGYELRCRDVVEALVAKGHEVVVLTSDHHLPGVVDAPSRYPVHRVLKLNGYCGKPWRGIWKLRHVERHNNEQLRALLTEVRPDIVHVWNMGGISKSLALTLQGMQVPTVYDVSDHWIARSLAADVWLSWWNKADLPVWSRLARGLLTVLGWRCRWQMVAPTNPRSHLQFQRIYFCSQRLKDLTVEKGYSVSHGGVIHCPVDTMVYDGTPKPAENPVKKLLYAGRLAEDKGVFTALRAMKLLKGKFDGELSIYGRGEASYETRLKEYARSNELRVTFHAAGPEEMPKVYKEHDALLFTSEWEEPFALTPLEAMSSGLPVIGTTTGGSAELFRHGQNALTYRSGDAWELSQRILQLAEHPDWRFHMACSGFSEVREQFSLSKIADRIERYLEETLTSWTPTVLPHI
jgi:glycosyltransferase involved in cell wall biosynthesis